jgi:hypothetical protein
MKKRVSLVAQKGDYHRFGIDGGLVNDKLQASATIRTKQDVLFGDVMGETRWYKLQWVESKQERANEVRRGKKQGSVAGRAREISRR